MIKYTVKQQILKNSLYSTAFVAAILLSSQSFADGTEVHIDKKGSRLSSSIARGEDSVSASSKIKTIQYNESEVYAIRTKYGYQTNIIFDPKEEIKTISVGDRSLWQIIPAENRLFIRPMTENISTNMSLITNKRSYEFELKSVSDDSQNNIYVARFVYPDNKRDMGRGEAAAPVAAVEVVAPAAVQKLENVQQPLPQANQQEHILKLPDSEVKKGDKSSSSKNNYSYTYTGPDDIAPLQVYDNGKSTFIKYKKISKPYPDIFIVDKQGKESKVKPSVNGSFLVISKVAGEIVLRSSTGEIKIYNEASN